jgi:exopolysaccharide biosynthesis polyprenyl glycosylphosphotransferase
MKVSDPQRGSVLVSTVGALLQVLHLPAKQSQKAQRNSREAGLRAFDLVEMGGRKSIGLEMEQTRNLDIKSQRVSGNGILIIGTGSTAHAIRNYLTSLPSRNYEFRGFAGTPIQIFRTRSTDAETYSSAQEVIALARSRFVDEVIFTEKPSAEFEAELIRVAAPYHIHVRFIPDVSETLRDPNAIRYIGDLPTILLHEPIRRPIGMFVKRCVDVVASSMGLIVLSPLMLLIGLAIRLDSSGPIFYTSPRIGKKGRTIRCHKFRTMVPNAAAMLPSIAHLNDRDGVLFKIKNDPRITRIGRFLRKYSLDELPQLWNVVRGDMSLVGPRPCIESEVAQYKTHHYRRLDVLPGITGLWQVEARCDPSFESYIQLDSKYVDEWSVWLDLKLIARTLLVVVMGTGA